MNQEIVRAAVTAAVCVTLAATPVAGAAGIHAHPELGPAHSGPEAALPEPLAPPEPPEPPTVEPADAGPGPHLPDLSPLPVTTMWIEGATLMVYPGDFVLDTAAERDPYEGYTVESLRIETRVVNRGRHSLELVGVPRPPLEPGHPWGVETQQCIRFAGPRVDGADRACRDYESIGALGWHPWHGHFHIPGFLRARLLREVNGGPDRGPGGAVAGTELHDVCVADTEGPGAPRADTGWYRECRHTDPAVPVTLRQGISPGWMSTRMAAYPSQRIVINHVPDGYYWIELSVNQPDRHGVLRLHETDRGNNVSYSRIRIKTKPFEVRRKREAFHA